MERLWLGSGNCEGEPTRVAAAPSGFITCPGPDHHSPLTVNLTRFVAKLLRDHKGEIEDERQAEAAITEYRRMLTLVQRDPTAPVVPSRAVDLVWHEHILDTAQYRRDSLRMFGRYIDHAPSFGEGEEGDEEKKGLQAQQALMFKVRWVCQWVGGSVCGVGQGGLVGWLKGWLVGWWLSGRGGWVRGPRFLTGARSHSHWRAHERPTERPAHSLHTGTHHPHTTHPRPRLTAGVQVRVRRGPARRRMAPGGGEGSGRRRRGHRQQPCYGEHVHVRRQRHRPRRHWRPPQLLLLPVRQARVRRLRRLQRHLVRLRRRRLRRRPEAWQARLHCHRARPGEGLFASHKTLPEFGLTYLPSPDQFAGYVPTAGPLSREEASLLSADGTPGSYLCTVFPFGPGAAGAPARMQLSWSVSNGYIYYNHTIPRTDTWYGVGLAKAGSTDMGLADYMITMHNTNYTGVKDLYKFDAGMGYPCWDVLHECSADNNTAGTKDIDDETLIIKGGGQSSASSSIVSTWNRKLVTGDFKDYDVTAADAAALFAYGTSNWFT